MLSTVVGSYPVELNEPSGFKDKLLNTFGAYDPFKESIRQAVFSQLDAGVDIVSDGQVRGDMVSSFSKYIPGFKIKEGNTYIVSKIVRPIGEISVKDLLYAKKLVNEYYNPSTIIHSSRISHFYKKKDDAIIDLAHSLKSEVNAIERRVNPVYIQVDEPFLSTGMVNMKVAREAIDILRDGLSIPLAMHVCGTLEGAYKDLANFNVDILDFEFAGNNVNLGILEKNIDLFKGKKIGFGCIDSSKNEVDSRDKTEELISKGIDIIGKDNILLDPDCGLRRAPMDVAFDKLKLMNDIKDKY